MKGNITRIILISWSTVSFGYIAYMTWQDYKEKGINQAYQKGKAETIEEIMRQSEASGCQGFTVLGGNKKIQLADVRCISNNQTEDNSKDKIINKK